MVRRWTSLKQSRLGDGGGSDSPSDTGGDPACFASPSTPLPSTRIESTSSMTTLRTAPIRKTNWQVIEHFGSKDKGSLSSSLIAVRGSSFNLWSIGI
ncbi:unnamed protein product [Acanthoscelides obtectus]|uniref:Uncharacterized protein n=1 Tax=Acanthoscelides obtectus TaxID=200917 RepID=A0A9P0Q521_ACAOB|nr:unnamed protein product [Acanthoscelides obtectus]CAK1641019.1 hypothetical protein AOBTE_LOCUS12086 [Acanthoscelides obtectus]